MTLGLTTALFAASAFLLAAIALWCALSDRKSFATKRDFDKLLDEYDEWCDKIRVALGRAARMKRAMMDGTLPTGETSGGELVAASPATPEDGSPSFPLTARQLAIQNNILSRRRKV